MGQGGVLSNPALGSISDVMVGETSLCANHALMTAPAVGIG